MSNNLEPTDQSNKVPVQIESVSEQREEKLESVLERPTSAVVTQEPVTIREERKYTSSSESTRGESLPTQQTYHLTVLSMIRAEKHTQQ